MQVINVLAKGPDDIKEFPTRPSGAGVATPLAGGAAAGPNTCSAVRCTASARTFGRLARAARRSSLKAQSNFKDCPMHDADIPDRDHRPHWDPEVTRQLINAARPIGKRWFRWEVHGLKSFPRGGGALTVSNHSGGMLTLDWLIFATAFYDRFGYDRPVLTLGHNALFTGPIGDWVSRIGLIRADRAVATDALQAGSGVFVFPGGTFYAVLRTVTGEAICFQQR